MKKNILIVVASICVIFTFCKTEYKEYKGCTQWYATNYQYNANVEDSSCIYPPKIDDVVYFVEKSCVFPIKVHYYFYYYPNPTIYAESSNQYSISFGDGTSSNYSVLPKSMEHLYTDKGIYTFTFKLSNKFGTAEKTIPINLSSTTTSANFSFSAEKINCLRSRFTFNNTSWFASKFQWDFGDSTSSESINPVHTYQKKGTYTVSLQAICPQTLKMAILKKEVTVEGIQPTVNFSYEAGDNVYYIKPAKINFTNTTTDATNYEWYINNSLMSRSKNFSYTFPNSGNFDVKLNAFCDAEQSYLTQRIKINPLPKTVSIEKITIALPKTILDTLPNHSLDLYCRLLNGNSISGVSKIKSNVMSFPLTFTLPTDISSGDFSIESPNYSTSEIITIEIWNKNKQTANDIWFFNFTSKDLQTENYPDCLTWKDDKGYSSEIYLKYGF